MNNFNDIQKLLQSDLKKLDEILIERLASDVVLINQMSSYIINAGGKRLRPLLLILAAKACNYEGKHHHLMAVVIELIHTATLLHDDIVDEAETRRGQQTANEAWSNAAAVLVGDFIYSRAFEMMVEPDSMQVMQILSKTTNIIAEGEVLQLLNCQNVDLSEAEYYKMVEQKTACLFSAAAKIGAVLAAADHKKITALTNYGMYLGDAFQIIDDVLDYQADAKIAGKQNGSDLADGKTTLPMIYALQNANNDDKKTLKSAIKNADFDDFDKVNNILEKTDSFAKAQQKAFEFADLAKKSLAPLAPSTAKNALELLADLAVKRQS